MRGPARPARARKLAPFGTTIFTETTRLANEHGAVNLAQGFPDFDGPDFAKDAAIASIRDGKGQYARSSGALPLVEAIARGHERRRGLAYDPEREVVVGCGATELVFAALAGVCDPGDEVILFEPFYDSYLASVVMAGATPRVVTIHAPSWEIDFDAVKRAITPRSRAIVLNTPHNPTGKVWARQELAQLAALAVEHDLVVISDEVYEHLVYEGEHVSIATLPGMRDRTITLHSVSKTFSLTGWRVGWALAAAPLADAVRCAHQFITFAAPTPLSLAAAVALAADDGYYDELVASYRARRELLSAALADAGFDVWRPAGAYFVCAGIERFGFPDDVAFCRHLVERVGVAAIPPSAFYVNAEHAKTYVRFVFCKREETLRAAAERLRRLGGGG